MLKKNIHTEDKNESSFNHLILSEDWPNLFGVYEDGKTLIDYIQNCRIDEIELTYLNATLTDQKLKESLWRYLQQSKFNQTVLTIINFLVKLKNFALDNEQITYLINILIDAKQTELLLSFFHHYKPHYFLMSSSPKGFDKNILVKVCSLPPPSGHNSDFQKFLNYFINGFFIYCNVQDDEGKTVFHWLALRGYFNLIQCLISKDVFGIDLSIEDNNKHIPSDYAKKNHPKSYQILKHTEKEANNVIIFKSFRLKSYQSLFSGNSTEAINICKEIITGFSEDDFYHDCYKNLWITYKRGFYIISARAKSSKGDYIAALKDYNQALALVPKIEFDPSVSEIYFYQYEAYLKSGNNTHAQVAYKKGLEYLKSNNVLRGPDKWQKYKNNKSRFLMYCVKQDWITLVKILLRTGEKLTEEIYKKAIAIWTEQEEPLEVQALFDYKVSKGGFSLYETIQLNPNNLIKIGDIIQAYEFYELAPVFNQINAQQLIDKIEKLITYTDHLDDCTESLSGIKKDLASIHFYLHNPNFVKEAAFKVGINKIKQLYGVELLRLNLLIDDNKRLTVTEAEKLFKGMTLLAQIYKLKRAYTDILQGKKYIKAGLPAFDIKRPLAQKNPIKELSLKNRRRLIEELECLRHDEVEIYNELLNLPYKLQHATNYYYSILNSGSLDSLTEIKRRDFNYKSKFSTNGNIEYLGNGGFVFFRLYVDGVNNDETRYGDSTLLFNLILLRSCGWISLHDQLKPFTNKVGKRTEKSFKWDDYSFLRVAQEKSTNNLLNDKLRYGYRITSIKEHTAKKNTQFIYKERSFLDEIFYADDILLGITLSVLRELRELERCGFRQYFLENFNNANKQNKIILLGKLIKGLFRIEGKYPVALRVESQLQKKTQTFISFAKTDFFKESDRQFGVINPAGDGRYNKELETNYRLLKLAKLQDDRDAIKTHLSIYRQQKKRKRTAEDEVKLGIYNTKIIRLEAKLTTIKNKLELEKNKKQKLIEGLVQKHESFKEEELKKFDIERLELMTDLFTKIDKLSVESLMLINEFMDLDLPVLGQEPYRQERIIATCQARINSFSTKLQQNQTSAALLNTPIGFYSTKEVASSDQVAKDVKFKFK